MGNGTAQLSLPWSAIDTILLDMDGTLLDLHFDNYFWADYLPQCYSEAFGLKLSESQSLLRGYSNDVKGTLNWYCLDYWSNKLALDIEALKTKVDHKIAFRPNAIPFLKFLKNLNKRIILATNAHPKTLELKLIRTDFSQYFNDMSSSHEIGYPKEEQAYWHALCQIFQLNPKRCLFIDDSLSVLSAAKSFGIGHLLAITQPDSQKQEVDCSPFTGIRDFNQLIYPN